MLDNPQVEKKNFRTSSEVIGSNKKVFFGALCFLFLVMVLFFKAQAQTNLERKNGVRPWYEDEKYTKQEITDNKPHFVVDTVISKGTLMIGADKYEESVTITKIK